MWAVLQFSFRGGGRIAPPFPWGLSDNGLVSAVCLFTVGIPLPEAKWCQAFSLVAIDEKTFNLDDLVEAKMKIEIPAGKGIPRSRIVKVGDLQRPVDFRPIPVSAGTRVGQPNEMRLLQGKMSSNRC